MRPRPSQHILDDDGGDDGNGGETVFANCAHLACRLFLARCVAFVSRLVPAMQAELDHSSPGKFIASIFHILLFSLPYLP